MNYNAIFLGGPKDRKIESYLEPPSQRVQVYADMDGSMVCADEQVTQRLGHYEREDCGVMSDTKHYVYWWAAA